MASVRVANGIDTEGIYQLVRRSFSTFANYSLSDFQELTTYIYHENPARSEEHVFGWVVEDADRIVGFLGLFPLSFNVEGQKVIGASGTMWCIDPDFQSYGLFLYKRYIDWGEDHLLIDSSSSLAANKIHEGTKLGMARVWSEGLAEKLYWVLDYRNAAACWLDRVYRDPHSQNSRYRSFRPLLETGVTTLLRIRDVLLRSTPRIPCDVLLKEIIQFDQNEVDNLLRRTCHQAPITLSRKHDFLNWRLTSSPKRLGKNFLIGCFRGPALLGYIAVRVPKQDGDGVYRVVDLYYDLAESDVARYLVSYVRTLATQRRGAFLEMKGFSSVVLDGLRQTSPIRTKAKVWPYWHNKFCERRGLTNGSDGWWTSGIDGDANIF